MQIPKATPSSDSSPSNNTSKISNMEKNTLNNNVNISFPSSLLEKNGVINIMISQGAEELVKEQATKTVDVPKADELFLRK